jgi:hypothetical protein
MTRITVVRCANFLRCRKIDRVDPLVAAVVGQRDLPEVLVKGCVVELMKKVAHRAVVHHYSRR